MSYPEIKRGDIWLANLGEGVGSIQGGFMRPTIIISNSICLQFSSVIHCIPLTSQFKRQMPTHVEISSSYGLLKDSIAMCEQTMLLPKNVFIKKVGQCDSYIMNKVNFALMVQFDLIKDKNNLAYA